MYIYERVSVCITDLQQVRVYHACSYILIRRSQPFPLQPPLVLRLESLRKICIYIYIYFPNQTHLHRLEKPYPYVLPVYVFVRIVQPPLATFLSTHVPSTRRSYKNRHPSNKSSRSLGLPVGQHLFPHDSFIQLSSSRFPPWSFTSRDLSFPNQKSKDCKSAVTIAMQFI